MTLPIRSSVPLVVVGLVLALLATACGRTAGQSGGPVIVTTTSILGDVTQSVVGEAARVEVLMGPGADPHSFEPSAAQGRLLREAELVVANGLELEEGLLDLLAAAEADGVRVLRVAEHVDPIPFEGAAEPAQDHDDHADEGDHEAGAGDDGHEHGPLDPHFWLDPLRMVTAVEVIQEEIADVAPSLQLQGEGYVEELRALHEHITQTLSTLPTERRRLVTNHESLGYLAARYDLEIVGVVVPGGSTLSEPSSQDLAALVEAVEEAGVAAIFTDTSGSARLAEAVASELDRHVAVVPLHTGSLGEPGSDADTYVGMMEVNVRRIAQALSS